MVTIRLFEAQVNELYTHPLMPAPRTFIAVKTLLLTGMESATGHALPIT
jgi:hypothetical protein